MAMRSLFRLKRLILISLVIVCALGTASYVYFHVNPQAQTSKTISDNASQIPSAQPNSTEPPNLPPTQNTNAQGWVPISMDASGNYQISGGNVYWGSLILSEADIPSFQVWQPYNGFSKDKNCVYITPNGRICTGIEVGTFTPLGDGAYSKDKNGAYYTFGNPVSLRPIQGADPLSFLALSGLYAKDKNSVYFLWTNLSGADPATFEYVTSSKYIDGLDYAKDKNHVYQNGCALVGVDPTTFTSSTVLTSEQESSCPIGQV